MCGIAGFFGDSPVPSVVWESMLSRLRQRGPDAAGTALWDRNFAPAHDNACHGLLHGRLSIRDPGPRSDQPMANDQGDIWICFNGEVYGWEREAAELAGSGIRFKTTSDTEFILRAYEAWGPGFLPRLRGMFAFAILDLRSRCLLLARDRLGLKPLLYHWDGRRFLFASTVRALLPGLSSPRLSAAAVDAYLAHRYVPAPLSIVQDVQRLPNAHMLTLDLTSHHMTIERYWTREARGFGSVQDKLDEAVRIRTASDRPVGLFLSGGIDSATVASSLAVQGYTNITAFTASFPGTPYDEGAQAQKIAEAVGLPHKAIPVIPNIREDFERLIADLDEPFADPSAIPLWYLSRAASEEVKVVLGGDGGDELFAGYSRYRQHARSRWRGNLRLHLSTREDPWVRAARRREELGLTWQEAYVMRFSGFSPALRRYLQPDYNVQTVYWRAFPAAGRKAREILLNIDFENYLPEYILRKGDLCTMAHGLELRAPLLDHLLVERVIALPDAERFSRPAKRVLVDVCPPCQKLSLLSKKKQGFTPPLQQWLQDDLKDRLEGLGARLAEATRGQIDARRVEQLLGAYRLGARKLAEPVYQLLVLSASLSQLGLG